MMITTNVTLFRDLCTKNVCSKGIVMPPAVWSCYCCHRTYVSSKPHLMLHQVLYLGSMTTENVLVRVGNSMAGSLEVPRNMTQVFEVNKRISNLFWNGKKKMRITEKWGQDGWLGIWLMYFFLLQNRDLTKGPRERRDLCLWQPFLILFLCFNAQKYVWCEKWLGQASQEKVKFSCQVWLELG